jgi:low temperature requirement protein LtrA
MSGPSLALDLIKNSLMMNFAPSVTAAVGRPRAAIPLPGLRHDRWSPIEGPPIETRRMIRLSAPKNLYRPREGEGANRVTNIELFFDLVFVFAITQLSATLRHDLSTQGMVHAGILFLAVWYVWICTSWVTNWLDPERWPVRMFLLVFALAGLALSTSLPQAFDGAGLAFAGAYAAMQVGRSLFMLWALGTDHAANTRNFQRIAIWFAATGLLWVAGGLFGGPARLWVWGIAIAIDYAGPAAGFWVPRLGRSTSRDWDVAGGHLAERCSLFIIIALGESVLVTGATASDLPAAPARLAAFVMAFAGTSAFWWIYFDTGAEAASERISASANPGHLARLAYTYLHLVIVAGIIAGAAGNQLLLEHPGALDDTHAWTPMLGGAVLFLGGTCLFKWAAKGWAPLSHLAGLALLLGLATVAVRFQTISDLGLMAAITAILLLTAAWESLSLRRPGRP